MYLYRLDYIIEKVKELIMYETYCNNSNKIKVMYGSLVIGFFFKRKKQSSFLTIRVKLAFDLITLSFNLSDC